MGLRISIIVIIAALLSLGAISSLELQSTEQHSPSDWVKEEQIRVYDDRVVLHIPNSIWAKFTDTNSMDPFLDEHANAIEVSPEDHSRINVGDVISYRNGSSTLIHRVIEKGDDGEPYFIVKGDNNFLQDPVKVRFSDIQGVVVAVIY